MIILETTRLILKTIEKEDSQVLHDLIFSNEETMKYIFSKKAFSLDESKKFIYKHFCKNNAIVGLAPLFEKKSGLLVGLAGVIKSTEEDEFTVVITDEFRRNGFATEVAESELIFIKKRLRKPNVNITIDKENTIAKMLLEKVGMKALNNLENETEVYTKKV